MLLTPRHISFVGVVSRLWLGGIGDNNALMLEVVGDMGEVDEACPLLVQR